MMSEDSKKRLQKVLDGMRVARGELRKASGDILFDRDDGKKAAEAMKHIERAICELYFWISDLKDKEKYDG